MHSAPSVGREPTIRASPRGLGTATTIRIARHGVQAGVLGAALLAVHELEDRPVAAPTSTVAG